MRIYEIIELLNELASKTDDSSQWLRKIDNAIYRLDCLTNSNDINLKDYFNFIQKLNLFLEVIDINATYSDDICSDSGGKYDDAYYAGVELGVNQNGKEILEMLKEFNLLSENNLEKFSREE